MPDVICYKCKQSGHYSTKCTDPRFAQLPLPPPRSTPRNAMVRAQPRAARVNNVMVADAQQSSEIVLGRFLVNSVPVAMLFDSGASHSFVSQKFADEQVLSLEDFSSSLRIVSPDS